MPAPPNKMNNVYYIRGVKVQADTFGIKIFTCDKNLADNIFKYWNEEFAPNHLTGEEYKDKISV